MAMMIQVSTVTSLSLLFSLLIPLFVPCECHQRHSQSRSQGIIHIHTHGASTASTASATSSMSRLGAKRIIQVGNVNNSMNINVPTNVRAVDLRYVNQQRRKQEQKHKNEQKQQEQRNFDIETEVDVDIDIDIDILNDVVAAADTSSFSMWRQSQRGDQYLFTVRGGGETNDDAGEKEEQQQQQQ